MNTNRKLRDGWRWVRFGDVVREVRDTSRDPDSDGLTRVVGLEHLDSESLPLRRWNELSDLADGTSFTRVFRAGQVLFGKRRAYQRKVAVADFDGICSSDIIVLEPSSDELLLDFLPYLVQSDGFFDHALATSSGSLSPRTKFQDLAKYEFALPRLDEQQRIAELFHLADSAFASYEFVTSTTNTLKSAISARAVSFTADALEQQTLGDLCEVQVGFPFKSDLYANTGIRLLRCSNVGIGSLTWPEEATRYWPVSDRDSYSDFELTTGDVVIAMDRPLISGGFKIARVQHDDLPALLLQRVARLRPRDGVTSDLLWMILNSPATPYHLMHKQKGTDLPHISRFDIESIPVALSPSEYSKIIKDFLAVVNVEKSSIESNIRLRAARWALLEDTIS